MGSESTMELRISQLVALGEYMSGEEWQAIEDDAMHANPWFTTEHIAQARDGIVRQFLDKEKLTLWATGYQLPACKKNVGIVMAGNIPMVGFHDLLCGIVSGHNLFLKLSSKDELLMKHAAE